MRRPRTWQGRPSTRPSPLATSPLPSPRSRGRLRRCREPGTVTANLTLFPKVNTLVINSEVFDDLDDERQDVLRTAAAGAREWAATTQAVPEPELAAAHCDVGGSVVLTTDAELSTFEEAAASVYAELERDETTRDLIERIRELKAEMPEPAAVEPCGSPAQDLSIPPRAKRTSRRRSRTASIGWR